MQGSQGRRPHRTEAETRELVANALIDHVAEQGIGVVPDLPMEAILGQAGVSRASAYRLWPGKAQFRTFALEECVAGHAMGTLDPVRALDLARESLAANADPLTGAAHFVKLAADEELMLLLTTPRWRAFASFHAVAASTPTPELARMLAKIDREDLSRLSLFYTAVAEAWGLKVRDDTDIEQTAAAALMLARSAVVRSLGSGDDVVRTTYASALAALVRGSFVLNEGAIVDWGPLEGIANATLVPQVED
ncbi:MAG: hypothetical protein L0G99_08700 [Propionibacteriales bacterium]|nr:hypothetical protein [Propionibacteriales bacterium]